LLEKMMRLPPGKNDGANDAAPRCVTWVASEPSASAIQSSSCDGRTRPCFKSARYSSSAAPLGRDARQTIFVQSR